MVYNSLDVSKFLSLCLSVPFSFSHIYFKTKLNPAVSITFSPPFSLLQNIMGIPFDNKSFFKIISINDVSLHEHTYNLCNT